VRYGRPEATDDDVMDACRAAGMDDYIQTLPRKYETLLGERGYRLSGGQRQRLAIARIFLSRCSIVVLDEATSHLESALDNTVQRELMRRLPGRVLIVVAHRLSTVFDADEIVVLGGGSIVERGRDADLRERNGQYMDLF